MRPTSMRCTACRSRFGRPRALRPAGSAPDAACPAADLTEADHVLSGSITNTLPFPLRDCMLAYGTFGLRARHARARRVGTTGADGQAKRVEDALTGQEPSSARATNRRRRSRRTTTIEHGSRLHLAEDDVLPGGRRAALHPPVEQLPGVRRSERLVEDRSRDPLLPGRRCLPPKGTKGRELLGDGKPLGRPTRSPRNHVSVYFPRKNDQCP